MCIHIDIFLTTKLSQEYYSFKIDYIPKVRLNVNISSFLVTDTLNKETNDKHIERFLKFKFVIKQN